MRSTRRVGLLACLLLVGCRESQPEEFPSLEIQGVLEELVRIDGQSENLVAIGAVAVRSDGAVAMAQAQDGQIRLYSAMGEFVGSFGRRGEGPGEFSAVTRLGWLADTLWVYDTRIRRITKISPSLELLSTVANLPSGARPGPSDIARVPEFPFASLYAMGPGGTLYSTFSLGANQVVPEPFQGSTTVGSMTPDGVIEEIIAILPASQYSGVTSSTGGSAGLPFGNSPRWGMSVELDRGAIAMAAVEGENSGTYDLTAVGLGGDTLFVRQFPFPIEPIPQAVGDSAMQAVIAMIEEFLPNSDLDDAIRRDGGFPPIYPPLARLVLGSDGTIWIELRPQPKGVVYHAIDAEGAPIGTLVLKPGSQITAAAVNQVWVNERDVLGVQSLVKYAVTWQSPSSP